VNVSLRFLNFPNEVLFALLNPRYSAPHILKPRCEGRVAHPSRFLRRVGFDAVSLTLLNVALTEIRFLRTSYGDFAALRLSCQR